MSNKQNFYYTIKDEDGIIRPRAILEGSDKYGKQVVKDWIKKSPECKVVLVEVKEVKENNLNN
jgi:hypothetical protein